MTDLAVIGAGPAGLAAAARAAEGGLDVFLLDENPAPGGQVWRGIAAASRAQLSTMAPDHARARAAVARLRSTSARYRPGATVWQLAASAGGIELGYTAAGSVHLTEIPHVIVATGAQERPFPIPGWTLPGVLTAGGAQTLLKSSGLVPRDAVLAGTGPLLYLLAVQLIAAGAPPKAILDTASTAARRRALRHLPAAILSPAPLLKGLTWRRQIRRAGVPHIEAVASFAIEGETQATAIHWRTEAGETGHLEASHILLHQGVVPSTNLTMAAGLDHEWDDAQLAWRPRTDRWGRTSHTAIHVAGDGAGLEGWEAAEARGEIAALDVLHTAGHLTESARDRAVEAPMRARQAATRLRPFLDALYRPAPQFLVPEAPATIVCRCEEITAGELAPLIATGLRGPNQLKSFSRAGMGACQGRFCGLTVQAMIAAATGQSAVETGYCRLRPPVKPVPLGAFADMTIEEPADAG
ncbi:MAG: NAD(P)/FAD-dependent oxidoreductase [Pseudomonadota bacterium]